MNGRTVADPSGTDPPSLALPGYERLRFIGRGGTATVYSATRSADSAAVAVKIFDSPDTRAVERQLRIAERLRGIIGVSAVLDRATLDDGRHCLVFPFAAGGPLSQRLERFGSLRPAQVGEMGEALARTLGDAHRAGVLHRDLKPSNVLLEGNGTPLLGDFGAATTIEPATASDTMSITIMYAAPEVLEGATADERSDIYSLGLTLTAAATGEYPFSHIEDPGLATLVNTICGTGAPDPHLLGVPAGLAAVLRRATALDPDARYPDADSLADALEAVRRDPDALPATATDRADGGVVPAPTGAALTNTAVAAEVGGAAGGPRRRPAAIAGIALALVVAVAVGTFLIARRSGDDTTSSSASTSTGSHASTTGGSTATTAFERAGLPVTAANGVLGPLYQQTQWEYVGQMTEPCGEHTTRAAMLIHAGDDDRKAGVATPWDAARGKEVGVFMSYLPCEAGGTEVRFTTRAPGRWFAVVADFTQDQYDRMVAWMRENETSPAPDYSVDDDHWEWLKDPAHYAGWAIIDRSS